LCQGLTCQQRVEGEGIGTGVTTTSVQD
jgi:hypothetical protein